MANSQLSTPARTVSRSGALLIACLALGACATSGPPGGGINDPYESVNREVHEFNVALDRAVLRPVSMAYGTVFPQYVRGKVNNFSHHLDLPGEVINDVLQGRVEDGVHNTFRFLLNTTLGVFGIFDPATSFGLERRKTDFGETLHVWGVGEGAYVETPVLGPYTQRALAGEVVDVVLNPLTLVRLSTPEAYIPPTAWALERTDARYEFRDVVDAVLYDSADSYAQTRLVYLENRRFELGQDLSDDEILDPYEELYGN